MSDKLPLPPGWRLADAFAVQSLERGEATPEQQQRVFKFIIETVAKTYDTPWRDTARETDRAIGSADVGRWLVRAYKMNLANFEDSENG